MALVILIAAALYLLAGGAFCAWFLARGVRRLDAGAAHAPRGFFVLIAPGVVAMWPLLLRMVVQSRRGTGPVECPDWARRTRRRHRAAWLALAVILPVGIGAGLAARAARGAGTERSSGRVGGAR